MANDSFEYDVAISFAREDRARAEELGSLLESRDIDVLPSEAQAAELAGGDFLHHIAELVRTKARYCLLLVSRHYPLQRWTDAERTAVQEHALRGADEYILPLQLEDADVPGMTESSGYRDLRQGSMESIADLLEKKLSESKVDTGPPPESHDLRSGNVPSSRPNAE